jgi:hypothetical protein
MLGNIGEAHFNRCRGLCLPARAAIIARLPGMVPDKIHTPGADRVALRDSAKQHGRAEVQPISEIVT